MQVCPWLLPVDEGFPPFLLWVELSCRETWGPWHSRQEHDESDTIKRNYFNVDVFLYERASTKECVKWG